MTDWKIFVHPKPGCADHRGEGIKKECARAGLKGVKSVRTGAAYAVEGISEKDARRLAEELLADPITQAASVFPASSVEPPQGGRLVQVWPKNGVSDPVGDTVLLATGDLKIPGARASRSGQVFTFFGAAAPQEIRRFCEEHLMNALVQKAEIQ